MRFVLFDHQAKSKTFVDALAPKYVPVPRADPNIKDAKFVLTDNDVLSRQQRLEGFRRLGIQHVFVYPHTARPSIVAAFYDLWQHTTAEFVSTEGHIEIMRAMGNTHALHAVGWSLCPILPFQSRAQVRNVLFAPIHPRNSSIDRKLNQAVLDKLYPFVLSGEINLTVRYLIPFEGNGIKKYEHVNYVEGTAGPAWKDIDAADLVVSHQTFAMLSVARGVPTLMMGEGTPQHVEFRNGDYREARGWDGYHHLIDFPLDLLAVDDARSLMQRAVSTDADIIEWKSRMIGDPFDGEKFVKILESYL
jgi:hypothetical protein